MTYSIWTETLPESYHWTPTNYIGGTPEYVVNTAENLVKLGNEVFVYYDGEFIIHNGVSYFPRSTFTPTEVVLHCNEVAPQRGKFNISWTSKYGQTIKDYPDMELHIVLSQFHQDMFGPSLIIPLACDYDKLEPLKKKKQAIYTSSPDRGLDFLLKIWPKIYECTHCTLKVSYGGTGDVTGVKFLGKLTENQMNRLYRESMYWVHPCQGIELFCISGYKAQTAGCWPVVIPNMALKETVKFGTFTNEENFQKDFIDICLRKPRSRKFFAKSWLDITRCLDTYVKTT